MRIGFEANRDKIGEALRKERAAREKAGGAKKPRPGSGGGSVGGRGKRRFDGLLTEEQAIARIQLRRRKG